MPETKTIRIDTECEEILRKYSEGSLSDCIRAMEITINRSCGAVAEHKYGNLLDRDTAKSLIRDAVKDEMRQYKDGIKAMHSEIIARLSSMGAHSRPQLGEESYIPPKVGGPNGPAELRFAIPAVNVTRLGSNLNAGSAPPSTPIPESNNLRRLSAINHLAGFHRQIKF